MKISLRLSVEGKTSKGKPAAKQFADGWSPSSYLELTFIFALWAILHLGFGEMRLSPFQDDIHHI